MRKGNVIAGVAMGLLLGATTLARGQVGEPSSFDIVVKQGGSTIAQGSIQVGPGQDLEDIKISDGDAEDFAQLVTMTGSGLPSPIIVKLVTSDDPIYRLLSFYIDVPLNMQMIDVPGANSLFDPASTAPIEVTISNMVLDNGAVATPQLGDHAWFYTSFMRDYEGHFYESPLANPYNFSGNGVIDIQVPGSAYLDGDASQYTFAATSGASSSWIWGNIVPPGPSGKVHNGTQGNQTPVQPGYVFELGLSVALAAIPEPSTAAMMLLAGLGLLRRRR